MEQVHINIYCVALLHHSTRTIVKASHNICMLFSGSRQGYFTLCHFSSQMDRHEQKGLIVVIYVSET